jgi:hypothetical protein
MKSIHTLVPDIQELLKSKDGWFTDELSRDLSDEIAVNLKAHFNKQSEAKLRISKLGPTCPCALWHSIHKPELAEELPPWAMMKFAFGHILEALVISLSKAAGHTVTGEQDELSVDGVKGHRDCVIDGNIVDVKSAASRSFAKFKDGSIAENDSFGYLDQLDGYLVGSASDPLVSNKSSAFLLAVDKQLGHICLYEHFLREDHIRSRIASHKHIVASTTSPSCTCQSIPDGKSGNMRLDTKASYNSFKYVCKPNLRTFLYSDGPRHLTTVARLPDVTEVDKHGKFVYH